ncbi:MAG: phosphatidylglycerol lysyltransferase [Treponema sp.]|jgi:phosphoglucomutase|nr:phosphatidylglycerol lysyltransferase [Treponema sp.]
MIQDDEGRGEELDKALEGLILSASGWRGVFASGGGESGKPDISPAFRLIAAAAARCFAAWLGAGRPGEPWPRDLGELLSRTGEGALILVGTDTRPTGPALAGAVISALLASGCRVSYAGVLAAPEIMAWARSLKGRAAGFIYISASHNPIGHNGLKFGLTDGGVLQGTEAASLIRAFRILSAPDSTARVKRLGSLQEGPGKVRIEEVYAGMLKAKKEAYGAYFNFTSKVVYGGRERELREALLRGLGEYPVNMVADFNGSARAASIDSEFLGGLGIQFRVINGKPGEIAHRIVPEGESLEPCRRFLAECHGEDPRYLLGYLPDCDGDRGNLVIWDGEKARSLEAQEVFALCCVAELAHLVWTGESEDPAGGRKKTAVAVNDPTSMRVDRIAGAFGAEVFRAEVGEANVVGLARELRERGYLVRILGEGSAGGNITHPSAVRDPMDTLFSLLKLLCVREGPAGAAEGFFPIWISRRGGVRPEKFGLSEIIDSLPPFVTTGAYEEKAVLKVKTRDHGKLKDRYQRVFLEEWENRKEELRSKYGIVSWEAAAYNGTRERRDIKRFGEAGRGGLKVHLLNGDGLAIAAMWMRGSATEPVFRVMADVEGRNRDFEKDLINWQRGMVSRSDAAGEE